MNAVPRRRYRLGDLFLFVAFCSLLLAFFVPLFRDAAADNRGANLVQDAAFSADGSTVAALFGNGKVRVWRVADQSLVATFDSGASLMGRRIVISSDGALAAVFTGFHPFERRAGSVEVWNIRNAEKVAAFSERWYASLAFSPQDGTLAIGNQDSSIDLYRCVDGDPPTQIRKLESSAETISESGNCPSMAFSADGKTLVTQSSSGVWFWNIETAERCESIAIGRPLASVHLTRSNDGKYVAFSGWDLQSTYFKLELEVWDAAASKKMPRLPLDIEPDDPIDASNSLAFLPDGRTLLFAGGDLCAWDVETGAPRSLPDDADTSAMRLAAPCWGNRFAVADIQKITLWDAATLEPREVLWTPPAGGPSTMLIAAAMVLFMVWAARRGKKLARQCATCGQTYYLANAKDTQTECPNCRLAALPAEAREKRRVKDRRKRRGAYALICVSLLAMSFVGGARMMLAIMPAAVSAIAILMGGLLAWAHLRGRRLAREKQIVELIESFAGAPAEVLRFGPVMVWCGEGTTLGLEVEPQLALCADRVLSLAGQSVSAGPWLRCFVFGNREHFEQALKAFGFVLGKGSHYDSCYFGSPPRVALLEENQQSRKMPEPLGSLDTLLTYHLIESLDVSTRTPWLNSGLARVVAHTGNPQRLARLNRRVLADLAAGRTLDAQAFFARMPRIVFCLKFPAERDFAAVAKAAAAEAQIHSFMEFLCGAGSTPERRAAFQKFLADPRRRKRQAEALVVHFGCSPEKLLDDWRRWVEQLGVGEHVPPPAEYAEVLASGPVATIKNEQAPLIERLRAIRRLGREGFAVGVDALVDVLRRGPEELAAEATWALEAISGLPLGADVARWEAWRADLPDEAVSLGAERC